ncbi:uncharacterized protein LOC8264610 isoform X2 [Ricinus communis]|uniref:uncharacterized protein LOC8264610 isoform X2 n=1 Tax=Ricinus communis TaxID=3988 RepID=UPI00201AD082|nr:uncharacterized protein LOC8264610 isoform X2 [Ricinus communis]
MSYFIVVDNFTPMFSNVFCIYYSWREIVKTFSFRSRHFSLVSARDSINHRPFLLLLQLLWRYRARLLFPMAKSKEEEEEEEKSNGLEIVSIGSLYTGIWDKKYWSSSRGKDRYPYPVGYQARRAYHGSTYKMEIQEGPKGPLFLITSAGGHSCSGQTPDIAWEKFQKKGCSRMKIWHGKRYSCKIDGIEFFGFRNPLVQRLLRELVANVNGIAEQSLLASIFCNGASNIEPSNQYQDPSTSSDLLSHLARSHVTGKRSKRCELINPKPSRIDGLKRLCAGDSSHGSHKQRTSLPSSTFSFNEMHDSCMLPGAVPAGLQLNSATGKENAQSSAKDDLLLESVHYPNHLMEKAVSSYEESKLAGSENNESNTAVSNSCLEEKPLDRLQDTEVKESNFAASPKLKAVDAPCLEKSQMVNDVDLCVPDTELQGLNFPASLEFKAVDDPCPEESQSVHDVNLCAPDTLDFLQDDTKNSAPITSDKITCGVKEVLMVTDLVVSEHLVNTSCLEEEEAGTSNSNVGSEKSDFDSVGQDIAKSMMTVLLPQAVPLLKKTSRKKKKTISSSKNFPSICKPYEESNGTGSFMKAQSPNVDHSVVRSCGHTNSIILDKFDGDQCQDHVMNREVFPSNNVEAAHLSFGEDAFCLNGDEQFVETRYILYHDEGQLGESKMPLDGDLFVSESNLGCMPASKKVSTHVNQFFCKNLDEDSSGAEINSEEKIVPDCDKGLGASAASVEALGSSLQLSRTNTLVKDGASEISNISSSQVPEKVYTRRKVLNAEPTARKHNPRLLKSLGCRRLSDVCILETTGTLLDSEPFNDKNEVFYEDARVGRNLHVLPTDKTAVNSNPALESPVHITSVTQANICALEGHDTSNIVVPSMSDVEKPLHFEERLVGLKNTLDINGLGSQEEGKGFDKTSSAQEGNSEIMRQWNSELTNELDGIVEFLGCYFHPMPVLSLLVRRKGNEIYICVLCGLLVEKDRTLFLYKLAIEGPRIGCPCFIGHTSVTWPSSTGIFGREISFERSGLQLTPDGQCLVLLGSTRAPCCREGRLECLCSACASDCFGSNGVKIVQVKAGYVSVLVKLKTNDSLQCILVCEPDHLVAAGENSRLHLWTMNSVWSAPTEEFTIQSNDYTYPCIMELKRIPKCTSLVIGHDGFGEFTLWDISKRIFVSKFSSPSNSVHQFSPISLFHWQREVHGLSYSNVEAHVNRLMDATKMFSGHSINHSLPHEDIAIWFLVSTAPDSDALHDYGSSHSQINPVGYWRLALLMKNSLILGSALDPRAAAIGTSAGHGIIGTLDGLVYMWELLTGKKLGTLHKFKGGSASCIATDDSGSGVLAIADDKGQLLVYLCPQ